MTAKDVLKAMADSDELADEVLGYLNYGMRDEWDCSLPQGLDLGFGGPELRIAAQTGLARVEWEEAQR